MYEVDLIGGPEDGHTYAWPMNPPNLIYFPYMPEVLALLPGPSQPYPISETPKLVYRRIVNNLYWYQGMVE